MFYVTIEWGIDGEALLELVNDYQEFSTLVPAPLLRLKLKKFVREKCQCSEQVDQDEKVCS